ncbi:hypothetical protein EDC94DRAFT_579452 [Helicostylum pulchrum]|nr:hypothetical protein EDC94DRAFT_579452 [Helicostylum pulchrum]
MTRLRVTLLFWLENMMYMTDNIPAISLRKFIRSRKLKASLSAFSSKSVLKDGFPLVVEAASNDTSACAVSVDNPLVSYENFSSDNNSIAEIKPIEYISYYQELLKFFRCKKISRNHQCIVTKEVSSSAHMSKNENRWIFNTKLYGRCGYSSVEYMILNNQAMADVAGRVVRRSLFEVLKERSSEWITFFGMYTYKKLETRLRKHESNQQQAVRCCCSRPLFACLVVPFCDVVYSIDQIDLPLLFWDQKYSRLPVAACPSTRLMVDNNAISTYNDTMELPLCSRSETVEC